jgi:hypothetical protein
MSMAATAAMVAAAAAARDMTRLEPLVFFIYNTNSFFRFT